MRFERLAIPAFGPFTDVAIELPSGGADFHLVYGPNEAGKSSLLRAIRDLLYGIHGQTPDNFLHDYKALRIAATLCRRDGERLAVQRRKGNRGTLLDAAGAPLPDDALAPFLGAVDREYFTTMFGLDAAALRSGAAALLHGQGDLGQALFSASLAGTPVHRILDALDAEARRLFDGRARTSVTIRPAVDDYEEHLRASGVADRSLWGPEFEFYIFDHVAYEYGINRAYYEIFSAEADWNSAQGGHGHYIPPHGGYHAIPPKDALYKLRSEISSMRFPHPVEELRQGDVYRF